MRYEQVSNHGYLLKKPAADGIVGNRKAITYLPLPQPIDVGEIYTFYLRLNVAGFPNNHVFGLSDMGQRVSLRTLDIKNKDMASRPVDSDTLSDEDLLKEYEYRQQGNFSKSKD